MKQRTTPNINTGQGLYLLSVAAGTNTTSGDHQIRRMQPSLATAQTSDCPDSVRQHQHRRLSAAVAAAACFYWKWAGGISGPP